MNDTRAKLLELYLQQKKISTDTRKIAKGDIFFALSGPNFDGHHFVNEALQKGAKYCVIDNPTYDTDACLLVNDVLTSLQNLALDYRKTLSGKVIGLTGSNGKTTTKELIALVLSSTYKTFATRGNYNNHIGVPLTILSCPQDIDFLVVEMGANAQGEIALLSTIAEPDYGLITNIGKAHLEGFGGIEGVKKGKTELYRNLAHRNKSIFLNPQAEKLVKSVPQGIEVIPYLDYELIKSNPGIELKIGDALIRSQLFGHYNATNIIAAVTIARFFEVPWDRIKDAIETYTPDNNRSSIKKIKEAKVIFDAYNANPSSMEVTIRNFAKMSDERKIVIIGDMLELGEDSAKEHKRIMAIADSLGFDQVFYVGKEFAKVSDKEVYLDHEKLKTVILPLLGEKVTILIKGSRGIALEKLFSST